MDTKLLKYDESAILTLRALYKQYGYLPYKMGKFEEYELYVQNKDFLVSDRVITFNDTNGKLMALKPDVTLSIIKNAESSGADKTKVYYNENVYRVSDSTHQYKEIMQAGIELIADIDNYDIYETVLLAAKSLESISNKYLLDISSSDILEDILDRATDDDKIKAEILKYVKEKNAHDIERLCRENSISDESCRDLCALCNVYVSIGDAREPLLALCKSERAKKALDELCELAQLLKTQGYDENVYVDFSIVNDMNYYNGILFRGFVDGISTGILSGGRYDKLMRRMGQKKGAVGFAIYLDLLEDLTRKEQKYDVDVLVIYNDGTTVAEIAQTVNELTKLGKSVSVQKSVPPKLRYVDKIVLG